MNNTKLKNANEQLQVKVFDLFVKQTSESFTVIWWQQPQQRPAAGQRDRDLKGASQVTDYVLRLVHLVTHHHYRVVS